MTLSTLAITGASGFVGRAVLAAAQGLPGVQLKLLARDPSRLAIPGAQVIKGTLADEQALAALCDGAQAVIHIAGAIQAVRRQDFFAVNEQGTGAIAAAALKAGVSRFVHVSSLAAREPSLSAYSASKRAGEHALAREAARMGWIIIRPPGVYGPGDEATLPLFYQLTRPRALLPGGPGQRVSLIHSGDLARALLHAATAPIATGRICEIDDGKPGGYGWQEICEIAGKAEGQSVRPLYLPRLALGLAAGLSGLVSGITGKPSILGHGKINELFHPDWVAGPAQLEGFTPAIGFARGFAETLAAYRMEGRLPPRRRAATNQPQTPEEP